MGASTAINTTHTQLWQDRNNKVNYAHTCKLCSLDEENEWEEDWDFSHHRLRQITIDDNLSPNPCPPLLVVAWNNKSVFSSILFFLGKNWNENEISIKVIFSDFSHFGFFLEKKENGICQIPTKNEITDGFKIKFPTSLFCLFFLYCSKLWFPKNLKSCFWIWKCKFLNHSS